MREINLTKGYVALVDDVDYHWLSKHKWCADEIDGRVYAIRATSRSEGRRKIYMHREIMKAASGEEVDHREGIGLDNRRQNLRKATRMQQRANQGSRRDNVSGIKGVRRSHHRWSARIRGVHLGVFDSAAEAHSVYAAKAAEMFGQFARSA